MKRFFLRLIVFLIGFVGLYNSSKAQDDTTRLSYKRNKLIAAFCDCVSRVNISNITSQKKATKALRKCNDSIRVELNDYLITGGYNYADSDILNEETRIVGATMISCSALRNFIINTPRKVKLK